MARSKSLLRGIVLVSAASLALTACAADETEPGGQADGGTPTTEAATDDCPDNEPPDVSGDGTLKIGSLLPQTGSLAFLGPPEFAGVDLAIDEINKAGGALGNDVEIEHSDSGDAQNPVASASVDRLFSANADAIVGAASSGVSLSVIDKITGAGVVQFSPANTSDEFSEYCDKGLYFRTAPPDQLQGRVLAELVASDGAQVVSIMALQDSYGTGLADQTEKNLLASNIQVPEKIIYDPKAPTFATEVSKAKAANPDAIVLIGFDETKKIIPEMVKQGVGPKDVPAYFVDGNLADYSKDFRKGTLGENVKGTLPGATAPGDFRDRLLEIDPKLTEFSYAAESYDATILTALGAVAADSDAGPDIAAELPDVSREGTECSSYEECKQLLENGEDIDYQGVSGPVDFLDNGDPSVAFVGIYQYKNDNTFDFLESRRGEIAGG
ncbi:MAG: ABC transporter substrate-binding protein [Actinophytocola sp.]|nr:ABC transporter substrate-binding protein [Actinophytocola sp.]